MSIKGSPGKWFEHAVRTGDLAGALSEASEIGPLHLDYALGILVLFGEHGDPRFARASAKWLARLILENDSVTIDDAQDVLDAFRALTLDHGVGRAELARICAIYGLERAARLLAVGHKGS